MAKTQDTVRGMTDSQQSDIIATMVSAMPILSFDEAQGIIGNNGPFIRSIGAAFEPYLGSKPTAVPALPTEFTIAGRIYELVPFLQENESIVSGDVMVDRAKILNANLGEEDCQFILERQTEIPQEFRRKFYLVFTDWRSPSYQQYIARLVWCGLNWYQDWHWLGFNWFQDDRLVRRRT